MRKIALALLLVLIPLPASADPEVVPGSQINLVARDARIPITVSNPDLEPIEVVVVAESTSFRLEVLEQVTVLIPSQSTQIAEVPVRAIANGPVQLRVWLEVNGEKVSEEQLVSINVNYDVELFLLVTFGVLMFALVIVGVARTSIKLRRRSID
ncbi:MAG: hypothetical protein F2536_04330 [Actinobacteria bacterium]|uniref:Unannotated protein n=1 Tax=freshwater metagenome TaxID=449393 RepID=A0A6J6CBK8_9ZZZZ|nr:hypothetical protein [Actinomycetota bacterium]